MGLLSKIGKGLKKAVKSVGKVVGSVAQIAAPIVSLVPGVGTAVGAVLGIAGGLLGPQPKSASPPKPVGIIGPAQLPAPVMAAAGFNPAIALALGLAFLVFKK